ncbi:MAG: enoyl-CoA hydratase/isomerase family protein [Rhodobacteraceae bacterium]|nr:enoyl-CoA hydratase/isomerase family protein [Paracoccaceae bacterium]
MSRDAQSEIKVSRDGLVGIVEIDRPPLNFFDVTLIDTLVQKMQVLDADPNCRAIVLAASGKVFCAGADFGSGVDPIEGAAIAEALYGNAVRLFEIATPIVAAVQGPAIGGGLGLALTADFRVASDAARFSANFAVLGMHCGFAISATLPRVVGQNAAAMMLYTGRRLTGTQAKEIGLVDVLVDQGDERAAALELATEIAAAAPIAVQDMRRTLRRGLAEEVRSTLAHELAQQRVHMATADFREGIRAASKRETPAFIGA